MKTDIEKITKQFKKYVSHFNLTDKNILGKYNHSIRVMNLCNNIANSIGYNDMDIVSVVGLLHDYGRFHQWTKYKTFDDGRSVDHGDSGVKFLFDDNDIRYYPLSKDRYTSVYNAIKYHNKYEVPNTLDEDSIILSNIVRDADKLDILDFSSKDNILNTEEDISSMVRDSFGKGKLLKKEIINNYSDSILCYLNFIYDINYDYSFDYLKKNMVLEKVYSKIKKKEMFTEYFEKVREYINSGIISVNEIC